MSALLVTFVVIEVLAIMAAITAWLVNDNLSSSIRWSGPGEYNTSLKNYRERVEIVLDVATAYSLWGIVAVLAILVDVSLFIGYLVITVVVLVAAYVVYKTVHYVTEELRTKARGEEE